MFSYNTQNLPNKPKIINDLNVLNQTILSRLPRETNLVHFTGVAKEYGVRCDPPCEVWKLLHREHMGHFKFAVNGDIITLLTHKTNF
jgi:hypothetical protein